MITIPPVVSTIETEADLYWNGKPFELMGCLVPEQKVKFLGKRCIARIRGTRGVMIVTGWVRGKEKVRYGEYNYLIECEVDRNLHRCGTPQIIGE